MVCLGRCWMSGSPPPVVRTFKVLEAFTGFSHVHCLDGLKDTFFCPGCILETAPTVGMVGRTHVPRTGRVRSLPLPCSGSRVSWRSSPPRDLLQHRADSLLNWVTVFKYWKIISSILFLEKLTVVDLQYCVHFRCIASESFSL